MQEHRNATVKQPRVMMQEPSNDDDDDDDDDDDGGATSGEPLGGGGGRRPLATSPATVADSCAVHWCPDTLRAMSVSCAN